MFKMTICDATWYANPCLRHSNNYEKPMFDFDVIFYRDSTRLTRNDDIVATLIQDENLKMTLENYSMTHFDMSVNVFHLYIKRPM